MSNENNSEEYLISLDAVKILTELSGVDQISDDVSAADYRLLLLLCVVPFVISTIWYISK